MHRADVSEVVNACDAGREGDYAGFSVGIVDGTATMFERMGYGIYAVSYTHLDVYQRQLLYHDSLEHENPLSG